MFWLEPDLPNSLAPGKRPRTTLTPSLALRGGEPVLAFGTPAATSRSSGSCASGWPTRLGGLNLQAAIDAPAWHTTSFPSSFYPREMTPARWSVEARIGRRRHRGTAPPRAHGHRVGAWSLGRLSAVSRDPETGVLRAAANPRGMQGYAAGR